MINARWAKPLDRQLILEQARGKRLVVTLEESVVTGGFGSGVLELLEEARAVDPAFREVVLKIIGIPADQFVDHGSVADLRRLIRLDAAGIDGPDPRDAGHDPRGPWPERGHDRLAHRSDGATTGSRGPSTAPIRVA